MDAKTFSLLESQLNEWVQELSGCHEGRVASYIPELARVDRNAFSVAIQGTSEQLLYAGDLHHQFTLQSVAKLIVLIGLLEHYGYDQLVRWIALEPTGHPFSSIAQLDRFGPLPSNPMVNAGAIALCARIPGNREERLSWIEGWSEQLFGKALKVNPSVFQSEFETGDRNRSIAYLLKSNALLPLEVEEVLHTYFSLCSLETTCREGVALPSLLAAGGIRQGRRVLSEETCRVVLATMATCGLYDESGSYLVKTGMPGKSGVSGVIAAVAIGQAGIMVCSPRLNEKGGSVRGHLLLERIAKTMHWHFAHWAPTSA